MTKKKKVLDHLNRFGSITQIDAIKYYNCFRLSARIKELREDGVPIITERKTRTNRNGEKSSFALYRLVR